MTNDEEDGWNGIAYKTGQRFDLLAQNIMGDANRASVECPTIFSDLIAGDTILLNDGLVRLVVKESLGNRLVTEVVAGGAISSKKGVNIPDRTLNIESFTEKDWDDLHFALEKGVDFVALSFVRFAADIDPLRKAMEDAGKKVPIIAKIEKREAVEDLENIIDKVDGVMVARGDLGVEVPIELVPIYQKRIIEKCNKAGKFVITATQMMESMVENMTPTRAEVTDVANAVFDGSDALMLSAETSVGIDPPLVVSYMTRIITESELNQADGRIRQRRSKKGGLSIGDAIGHTACQLLEDIGATLIVTYTDGGTTARLISKHRPPAPILALTPSQEVARRLSIVHSVYGRVIDLLTWSDQIAPRAVEALDKMKILGETFPQDIIITAGLPMGKKGNTNLIRIVTVDRNDAGAYTCT